MEEKEFEYLKQIVKEYITDEKGELRYDIFSFVDDYSTIDLQSVQNSVAGIGFDIPSINFAQFAAIKFLYTKLIIEKEKEDFKDIFNNDFGNLYSSIRTFMFIVAQAATKFIVNKSSINSVSSLLKILINNIDGYMLNSLDLREDILGNKKPEYIQKGGKTYYNYDKNATIILSKDNILGTQEILGKISTLANERYEILKHDNELFEMVNNLLVSIISYIFNLTREHGYIIEFCKHCKEVNLYISSPTTATEVEASKCCPECYIHYERKDEWKYLDTLAIFRKHTA